MRLLRPGGRWLCAIDRAAIHGFSTRLMDKKAKKRIDLLHGKLQTLRQQLAGAKKQMDEPDEVRNLEKQIAEAERELATLKTP